MAKFYVRNVSGETQSLSFPYRGVLHSGSAFVVDSTEAAIVESLGGLEAIRSVFAIEAAPSSVPVSTENVVIVDANLSKGGHHTGLDTTERDATDPALLEVGMSYTTTGDGLTWRLTSIVPLTWVAAGGGVSDPLHVKELFIDPQDAGGGGVVDHVIYARPTGDDTLGDGLTPGTAYLTFGRAMLDAAQMSDNARYIVDITGLNEDLPDKYVFPKFSSKLPELADTSTAAFAGSYSKTALSIRAEPVADALIVGDGGGVTIDTIGADPRWAGSQFVKITLLGLPGPLTVDALKGKTIVQETTTFPFPTLYENIGVVTGNDASSFTYVGGGTLSALSIQKFYTPGARLFCSVNPARTFTMDGIDAQVSFFGVGIQGAEIRDCPNVFFHNCAMDGELGGGQHLWTRSGVRVYMGYFLGGSYVFCEQSSPIVVQCALVGGSFQFRSGGASPAIPTSPLLPPYGNLNTAFLYNLALMDFGVQCFDGSGQRVDVSNIGLSGASPIVCSINTLLITFAIYVYAPGIDAIFYAFGGSWSFGPSVVTGVSVQPSVGVALLRDAFVYAQTFGFDPSGSAGDIQMRDSQQSVYATWAELTQRGTLFHPAAGTITR